MKNDLHFTLKNVPGYEDLAELTRQIPEADPGAVQAYLHMLKACGDFYAALDTHFARYGLSRGRFMVLMILFRQEDYCLAPAEIADRVGVTRATITGLVDGLEREGLVERSVFPGDRRKTRIRLTPKALAFIDKNLPAHYSRVNVFMSGLNDRERKTLVELLIKLETGLEQARIPDSDS